MSGLDELDRVWDHLDPDDPIIFPHTVAGVVPVRGNYSRAPVRKMQDYINGGWKSDNVVIDIDFGKGTYTQYLNQHVDTFQLSFLDGEGSVIRVKIGRSTVEVKIDTDGSLVLTRKRHMR